MIRMSAVARLKQRCFPNEATALLLRSLDQCDEYFGDELMWPTVKDCIRPTLYNATPKRDALIKDEVQSARFVMSIIASYSERQVSTGMMHTYRGILGFDGKSVRNIAESALKYLNDYDWLDYEKYQGRIMRLDDMVRAAG